MTESSGEPQPTPTSQTPNTTPTVYPPTGSAAEAHANGDVILDWYEVSTQQFGRRVVLVGQQGKYWASPYQTKLLSGQAESKGFQGLPAKVGMFRPKTRREGSQVGYTLVTVPKAVP